MADTKLKILKVATELVQKNGFNMMSYGDISKALKIKNAAVHYYFPSKEDLGVAILKAQQEAVKDLIGDHKKRESSELDQLLSLVEIYNVFSRKRMICAIGSMGADVATLPKRVQIEVVNDYEQVLSWLSSILETGREKRIFNFKGEAEIKAFMIFNNLIAGVLVARLMKAAMFKESMKQMIEELTNK